MIISRKKFEQELANARNEVLRQNDLDCRFRDVWNRVDDTNRRIFDLSAAPSPSKASITGQHYDLIFTDDIVNLDDERRVDTLYAELHPEQEKKHGRTEISCCGK